MDEERKVVRHPLREDVSWNAKLLSAIEKSKSHSLREDVSWNETIKNVITVAISHPLREDVSWNAIRFFKIRCNRVILFVRMWVEMRFFHLSSTSQWSSSSWGCELKYCTRSTPTENWSHPLREDVSWNYYITDTDANHSVILFVRMWVEMNVDDGAVSEDDVILFVRMWVEIVNDGKHSMLLLVILFVRMWVEMTMWKHKRMQILVILFVRMWVEMLRSERLQHYQFVILFVRMWVEIYTTDPFRKRRNVILFVRMWVEITYQWTRGRRPGHPLREDVSWNVSSSAWSSQSTSHPLREDVSWNLEEYVVNHRCSNMVLLMGRWIEISLIVFLSFVRRSHYYTSFNLNIKLNYRNLRGNFYMCS